jgi:hypothetical protein
MVAPIVVGILIQHRQLTLWAWLAAGLAAVGAMMSKDGLDISPAL